MTNMHLDSAAADNPSIAPTFARLRALVADCGANKHDRAIVLITACIEEGIDTAPRIIGTLSKLGLTPHHAAIILREGTGSDLRRHRWQRDEHGHYRLHH